MKFRRLLYHLFQLSFVIILLSCTEKVDLDPRERAVVVHAMLEDTTVQTVQLFYTSYVSEHYYPPVEEASVYMERMKDSLAIERYDFIKIKDGIWQGKFTPNQLGIYRLTVTAPNMDTITATTQFPLRLNWQRLRTETGDAEILSPAQTKTGNHPLNHRSFWIMSFMDYIPELKSHQHIKNISHSPSRHMHNTEETIRRWKHHTWLFEDFMYDIRAYAIYRMDSYISPVDSLSYAGSSKYKTALCTAIVEYGGYTMGDACILIGSPAKKYRNPDAYDEFTLHPLSYMLVQSTNTDYELYFKDVIAKSLEDLSDLTLLWKKDEIYSNIKNGLGIFAAECRYKLMVKDFQHPKQPPVWERYNIIIPGWND